MKTVTLSVLVIYTSLVAFLAASDAEKATPPANAPSFSPGYNVASIDFFSHPLLSSDSTGKIKKKEYHIYFENRSKENIEVAIHYKEYSGSWTTSGLEVLKPGEKKLMGLSDEQTYFYYGATQKDWKKKVWKGHYKFALDEQKANKLAFKRQDIWECYDSNMCNAFAVFK